MGRVLKDPVVPGLTGNSGISGNSFESYGAFIELRSKFELTIRTEKCKVLVDKCECWPWLGVSRE